MPLAAREALCALVLCAEFLPEQTVRAHHYYSDFICVCAWRAGEQPSEDSASWASVG